MQRIEETSRFSLKIEEEGAGIFGFSVLATLQVGFSVFALKNFGFQVLSVVRCGFRFFAFLFSFRVLAKIKQVRFLCGSLCSQMFGYFICLYFTVNPGRTAMWDSGFLIEVHSYRSPGKQVNFCLVCAIGLSEPLPHYSLFCGKLHTPSQSLSGEYVIFAIPTQSLSIFMNWPIFQID